MREITLEIETNEQPRPRPGVTPYRNRHDCRVCLGEHDEEIHGATVRVHTWLRREVTRYLDDEVPLIA